MGAERDAHLFGKHPKRILSLDGGGVRGLITLGMLKEVERHLSARSSNPSEFRLSDYFDLIGGTSTGALIATMLAMAVRVDRIVEIYFDLIPQIFTAPRTTAGLYAKFEAQVFKDKLNETFDDLLIKDLRRPDLVGEKTAYREPRLGSDVLKTGLAVIAKRIDTDSVWVITNNPKSKYWTPDNAFWTSKPVGEREAFHANRDYALRDIVRASASAPYFLDAVEISVDPDTTGLFLDGGVTPHNNPAAALFLLATLSGHGADVASPTGFEWGAGADDLFLLSLGTGQWRQRVKTDDHRGYPAFWQAFTALQGMINSAQTDCLTWMQAISEPASPVHIDGNLGKMTGLRIVKEPLLTFQRVDPVLELTWLQDNLGFDFDIEPEAIEAMRELDNSSLSNLNRCFAVGLETGRRMIKPELFAERFDADLQVLA
jgi:predicted acylesterase/phospholipase RssA